MDDKMETSALQEWLDKQQITEALHKYPIALDSLDRELLLSIGHARGRVSFDGMFEGDWPTFVDWVITIHKGLLFHNHRITNTLIELHGDVASSRTNVTATLLIRLDKGDADERLIQARYLDKWTRENGVWLISERVLARDLRRTTRLSAEELKARFVIDDSVRKI